MRNYILYHDNCSDGKMAAYTAHRRLTQTQLKPTAIPVNYYAHQMTPEAYLDELETKILLAEGPLDPNNIEKRDLYVLDFCFPVDHLRLLAKHFDRVVVLDHHKTSFESLSKEFDATDGIYPGWKLYTVANNCSVFFAENESGCLMTWRFFNPMYRQQDFATSGSNSVESYHVSKEPPSYVLYTSDRDLWKFDYPESNIFHAGMSLHRNDPLESYTEILSNVPKVLEAGRTIERLNRLNIENIIKTQWSTITLKKKEDPSFSVTAAIFNRPSDIASSLGAAANTHMEDVPVCLIYNISGNGKIFVSVRSRKGVDSSWFSLALGGGGHSEANGCSVTLRTLAEALETRVWTV